MKRLLPPDLHYIINSTSKLFISTTFLLPPPQMSNLRAQQWRQPMLVQAKAWLKIMTNQLTQIAVKTVDTDKVS